MKIVKWVGYTLLVFAAILLRMFFQAAHESLAGDIRSSMGLDRESHKGGFGGFSE